ncbi:MAG: hypothetical protein Q8P35_00270, partial [Candidatus Yanofskybacteria bacterium]|nr:hypothetical protein [Candidatus Yanofskybacteria bacterium]
HVQIREFFGMGWDHIWWNWQGIVRYEGSVAQPILIKKPSYYTYKLLEQKLYGYQKVETLNLDDEIFAYKFVFAGKNPIIVAWTEGAATTVNLSSPLDSDQARLTHIITEDGKTDGDAFVEITSANAVRLDADPVFIEAVQISSP